MLSSRNNGVDPATLNANNFRPLLGFGGSKLLTLMMITLTRSLVLGWLLQRRGVATELRIGVRLVGGVLDAHAWVEYLGVPVNDRRDVAPQFGPFSGSAAPPAFSSS